MATDREVEHWRASLPATAREAYAAGRKWYFTDRACLAGHMVPRYASSGECLECHREGLRRRRAAKASAVRLPELEGALLALRRYGREGELSGDEQMCVRYLERVIEARKAAQS